VGRAVAAARRALATLSPECFEWTTLTGVWGLPQHLFEGDGDEAAALRGVAWERLLQLFGDLEEAWASADGRAMWQQLPWRAVRCDLWKLRVILAYRIIDKTMLCCFEGLPGPHMELEVLSNGSREVAA
jgi:hypothetical protein